MLTTEFLVTIISSVETVEINMECTKWKYYFLDQQKANNERRNGFRRQGNMFKIYDWNQSTRQLNRITPGKKRTSKKKK